MKTAYITRYGAFGDHLHCSYFPRRLKEAGYGRVVFEYNYKGVPIYRNNPHIDAHIVYDPSIQPICTYPLSFIQKRHRQVAKEHGAEHIDLQNSIERAYIAMEDMPEYYMSSAARRAMYGGVNYYDQSALFANRPEFRGEKADLYFTSGEVETVERIFRERYEGKFVFIANLSGTSKHKLFINAEQIVTRFLDMHPDAVCITMGDEDCRRNLEFRHERVVNRCGKFSPDYPVYPFRQSMLMAKYADMIVGCESGLMVAATALGTPAVQLMTAASIKNHGGDFQNDYSLQAPCKCSPCHKGPYEYHGCPKFKHLGIDYPVCVRFDPGVVQDRMNEVYDNYRIAEEASAAEVPALR